MAISHISGPLSSTNGIAGGNTLPTISRPIMGLISHSFGAGTINKAEIFYAAIVDNVGTVKIRTVASLGLSALTDSFKVLGLGPQFDGIWFPTAYTQNTVTGEYTYTYTSPAAVGAPVPEFPVPLATAYGYSLGSGGIGTGYIGSGSLVWAMILMNRAFLLPPSYCYVFSGGNIVSVGSPDPGLALSVTAMLAKNPLPKYVYIDLGVNDLINSINIGQVTIAQMQASISTNVPRLVSAGITPIMMAVRPTGLTLTLNKRIRAYNKWLGDFCRQIGAIYVDSGYLMNDLAGTNASVGGNLTTCMYYNTAGTAYVHVNALGAKRDGVAIKTVLSKYLPAGNTPPLTTADAYDATYNPTGCIAPLISGAVPGLFTATVAPTPITATTQLTAQQIGQVYVFNYGTGTSTVTAEVRASTATALDGTLLPGFELALTFSAGSGPRWASVQLSASGAISSNYSAGDKVQAEAEVSIPSTGTNITTGVTYGMPNLVVKEIAGSGFTNAYWGCFSANSTVTNNSATILAGSANDVAFDGVLATPVITLRTLDAPASLTPTIVAGIISGSLTNTYTVIIRSFTIRKVDPVYGEPF